MNVSSVGSVERVAAAFRVRVRWNADGKFKVCRGPCRRNEETAKEDLESMRAAASGMSRRDGFAAMKVEADRLKAAKAPKEEGSVVLFRRSSCARLRWTDGGEGRRAYGPRRCEERRADEDLEFMREASSKHDTVLARRIAVTAEVRRLQQQAEDEVRVSVLARRLSQEQHQQQTSSGQYQRYQQQPRVGLQQQLLQQMSAYRHPTIEEDSESQSEWEPGEADDADVVYQWERFDERGRPLQEPASQQQQREAPLPPIPEPRSADEASLFLAQFRPIKRTPEELKRLLEAQADPNIVIRTETYGRICPLEKILLARDAHVPKFLYAGASSPMRFDILLGAPARYKLFHLYLHACTYTR